MFSIENNVISITRGDTGRFELTVLDPQGNKYDYDEDSVVFTVKANTTAENPLIEKTIKPDETIVIEPDDTANLAYGKYVYDVELVTKTGIVDTIITPHPFYIRPEVTF